MSTWTLLEYTFLDLDYILMRMRVLDAFARAHPDEIEWVILGEEPGSRVIPVDMWAGV